MMKKIAVLAIPVFALAACGSSDAGGASVTDAWARATVTGAPTGAVYFDLTVDEDDRLIGASVSSDVSAGAEIHEVVAADHDSSGDSDEMDAASGDMDDMETSEGSDDMDATDDTGDTEMSGDMGAMVMREMSDGLELSAGETVAFEPGGYHVMLPELTGQLEVGEEFDLTLDFENADDLTVTVAVSETAP